MNDLATREEWRPVVDWESLYEVSNLGRVRSMKRSRRGGNGSVAVRGGRILKAGMTNGYEHVTLSDPSCRKNARVHVLMLESFVGPRPESRMHGCHDDGNSRNNNVGNLYWGTPKQNYQDKVRHGTVPFALKRGACVHGHLFDDVNTYIGPSGSPTCRTCRREGMRRLTRKATS